MKQIKAVIRPEKLADVRAALEKLDCYRGVMITDIEGHGTQKGILQIWRGEKYQLELIPKVMMDLVVCDRDVQSIVKVIMETARVGDNGDGKIFVYNVEDVFRIRTGEKGEAAL